MIRTPSSLVCNALQVTLACLIDLEPAVNSTRYSKGIICKAWYSLREAPLGVGEGKEIFFAFPCTTSFPSPPETAFLTWAISKFMASGYMTYHILELREKDIVYCTKDHRSHERKLGTYENIAWKYKIQAWAGFKLMTSVIPVQCS